MSLKPKIILTHSDREYMHALNDALSNEFTVDIRDSNDLTSDLPNTTQAKIAVIELGGKKFDGVETMRRLQRMRNFPVIFLADERCEETDLVLALRCGGDDILQRPLSSRVLAERIKTVLRGYSASRNKMSFDESTKAAHVISIGPLEMDPERFLTSWNGTPVNLTVGEFALLSALAKIPGVLKTRYDLAQAMESENRIDERSIDSHVKRIRQKIKAVDPEFYQIETVYGAGYRYLNVPTSAARPETGPFRPTKPQI